MATIKKAQAGTKIDKTATKKSKDILILRNKPKGDYMNLVGKNPTKKDSSDYKKGYNFGKDKPKNSLQSLVESPGWNAGNLEGRSDKRPQKKIKLKSGGTIKKTYKKKK